jgi:hypothetical protein
MLWDVFDPPWKHLVEELKKQGHESPYLDRLRERLPARAAHADLQREILEEMASALRRSEDKVLVALLKLDVLGKELDALGAIAARKRDEEWRKTVDKKLAAHAKLRAEAERAVWELRVHREALGFRRNEMLATLYPIPPKRVSPG